MAIISYLTTIHFDFGAIDVLADELARLGIKRPLLVTDRGVVAAGLVDRIRARIPNDIDVRVFDRTPANPTEAASSEAAKLYREEGCDGLITLEDGRKLGVISPHLIPKSAICDPELTLDLPPQLTAGTGMDALTHCIETYIAPAINPPAEAIAMDGLIRAAANIEKATHDGRDRDARWEMMMAAMEGAMAFQKGLGAVHAMSHPLGALEGRTLHHGTLNAVILPTVLAFNADFVGDKYARIKHAIGLSPVDDLGDWIRELNRGLGLPENLREMGVSEADLAPLAPLAERDHTNATNPRPASAADYEHLYRAALDQRLVVQS